MFIEKKLNLFFTFQFAITEGVPGTINYQSNKLKDKNVWLLKKIDLVPALKIICNRLFGQ